MKQRNGISSGVSIFVLAAVAAISVGAAYVSISEQGEILFSGQDAKFEILDAVLFPNYQNTDDGVYVVVTFHNFSPYDIDAIDWYVFDDDGNLFSAQMTDLNYDSQRSMSLSQTGFYFTSGEWYTLKASASFNNGKYYDEQEFSIRASGGIV